MSGLIGKKIGMTSLYDDNGKNIPCTVLELGPCMVTQVRTKAVDGYEAVQLGFDDKAEKKVVKAEAGHFKKANVSPKKKLVEFQNFEQELNLGDTITVDHFEEGDFVDVSGTSKGKGFQGVVKRHGFGGVDKQLMDNTTVLQRQVSLEPRPNLHVYSKESAWQGKMETVR